MSLTNMEFRCFYKGKIFYLLFLLLFTGCFSEDMSECGQGVTFSFKYELNNKYWEQGRPVDLFNSSVNYLTVLFFDDEGKYFDSFHAEDIMRQKDFRMRIRLPEGRYSAMVWGSREYGNDYMLCHVFDADKDQFIDKLQKGVTTKDDFRLMVTRRYGFENGRILIQELSDIFYGNVPLFELSAKAGEMSHVSVSMMKNLKKLDVIVKRVGESGLAEGRQGLYDTYCIARNSQYDYMNALPDNAREVKYLSTSVKSESGSVHYNFNMLRLMADRNPMLYLDDPVTKTNILKIDIVAAILKHPKYNSQEDLDREDHFEFEIRMYSNLAVEVFVNGWKSYEVDIEI